MYALKTPPTIIEHLFRLIHTHYAYGVQVLWLSDDVTLLRVDFRHTPTKYEACRDNWYHDFFDENDLNFGHLSFGSAFGEVDFRDLARRKGLHLGGLDWHMVGQWP